MHGDICTVYQLRHRRRFVPSHARHRSDAASVHRRHKFSSGGHAAAFLANFTVSRGRLWADRSGEMNNNNNNNNNNNTSICKAHNVSIRAESEAPELNLSVAVSRYRRLIVSRVECVLAGRQTRICHRDFLRVGKYPLNLKHIPVLCPTDLHRKINDPRSVRPVLNTLIHTSSATWDNYTTDEWHEHLRACIFVSISKLDILIL